MYVQCKVQYVGGTTSNGRDAEANNRPLVPLAGIGKYMTRSEQGNWMTGLTRKEGAALHHQLFSILRTGILSGRYAVGDLLPSEEWLAENYNVSRATVRRAMQTLQARGMIERCPGVGTRVLLSKELAPSVSTGLDFGDIDVGELATQSFEFITAPSDVAAQLSLPSEAMVLRIVRLRSHNGLPVRVTSHYMPRQLGECLKPDMLGQKMVVDALATLGAVGQHAVVTIGAVIADAADAAMLQIEVGTPLIDLTRVVRTEEDECVLLQHTLIPPERQKLVIDVARDEESSLPVLGIGRHVRARGVEAVD